MLDLEDLYEFLGEDITPRQSDLIDLKTGKDQKDSLLQILKKRDLIEIGPFNINEDDLKTTEDIKYEIIQNIKTDKICQNLYAAERKEHEEQIKLRSFTNQNSQNMSSNIHPQQQHHEQQNDFNKISNFEQRKGYIYKEIACEIGRQWRAFGRGIGFREGEMDNLNEKYHGQAEERVYKMLTRLESDKFNNQQAIYDAIIKSLRECRRNKLIDKIDKALYY